MQRAEYRTNWIMRIASALLCLTLLSVYLLSNMYAKYVSSDSGWDNARVARFYVSDNTNLNNTFVVEIDPHTPAMMEITVDSHSETALKYTFTFSEQGNIPLKIEKTNTTNSPTKVDNNDRIWEIKRDSNFNQSETYTFKLSMSNDSYIYSGGVASVALAVNVQQID